VAALADGMTLRDRIRAGEELLGTFLDLGSAQAAEITAGAGFDWVVVDLEHGGGGRAETLAQIQALRVPAIVRVPDAASGESGWVLDHGAAGVLVPRVRSVKEATVADRATRYAGTRGLDPGSRASDYGRDTGYAGRADEERVLLVQIETRGALEDADAIARLEGVDALFVGPYDLGVALEVTPGAATPEVQEAAGRIAHAARTNGKAAAVFLGDPALAPVYRELGFTLISAGFTSALLAGAATATRDALRA
jgi:4-hydroxy-2-oxoheptanedioate aldolase